MSVEYQADGDVAVITLNRPDRYNAVDQSLADGLVESLGRAGVESRAVVITGAGKAFCSGADLADLMADYESGAGPDLGAMIDRRFQPAVEALLGCAVPVIGAINGVAAGAGLGLALACDLRVFAETATLTSAFTGIGLVPDSGTTWWLPHHLGVSRALELTLTNRRVGAQEALDLGLCVAVVPDDRLLEESVSRAKALADLVPGALVATRKLIREASGASLSAALTAEREIQARLGRTAEHREGVRAFTEKRRPEFRNA